MLNISGTQSFGYSSLVIRHFKIFLVACTVLSVLSASAQLFNFTTFAGSAGQGIANGVSTNAQFASPGGVAMDNAGNLFIADTANDTIRKITPAGTVTTFAGSPGIAGASDSPNALFNSPQAVAADSSGNIYVADTGNFTIRKITPAGVVSTIAGSPGVAGSTDTTGTNALFFEPEGIAVDGSGNLYVADTWNHTIRKINTTGSVSTLAGAAGNFGNTNGRGSNALFYEPQGVAADASGNVYVADTGNNLIRKINSAGVVSTLAGSGNFGSTDATGTNASFYSPQGISVDSSGNVYVADSINNTIRQITSAGTVTTIAGTAGNFGTRDGTNGAAQFWGPQGVTVNPTNNNLIYLADTGNSTLRQLAASGTNWASRTLAGSASIGSTDSTGTAARFFWPMNVAADTSGNLYVADSANNTIRKISPAGVVSTLAGFPGVAGSTDATGTNALFNNPQALAVDAAGNIFVSDTGNSTIRMITQGGSVSTVAGSPGIFSYADATGTSALFSNPIGIAVDNSDNIYVADSLNQTIRKVTSAGAVTTIAGYVGLVGSADGTNSVARFNRPTGLAMDGSGNLFVTDLYNHTIREITPAGAVITLAGWAGIFGNNDGTNNTALFFEPEGIAVNGTNVYVCDSGNHSIRQLTPSGTNWVVTTVAGWPGNSGSADNSGIGARFCYPAGLAVDGGNLIVADSGNNTIRTGSPITNNPPVILTQPQNQAVLAGTPATFNVGAMGSGTLYYQWQFNGVNIPGATASGFILANPQAGDAGSYSVLVSSPTGSAASSNAVLIVYAPPTITNQPASQTCLQGTTVAFSVVAGPGPLTYQWLKNGAPIPNLPYISGATNASLIISNATTADSATYSVLVNNGYGSIASAPATLTVFFVPPPDSLQPYAWWLLNEGAGTQAFDYSGNGHNGTLNTGASWTTSGRSGNGVYFNATAAAQVVVANPFIWTGDWTATMWVNRWEAKDASVLIGGTHDSLKLEQHSQTNHIGFTVYSVADYVINNVTPLGSWVHLAFVKTAAGISLYTNGVFAASNTHSNSLDVTTLGCDYLTDYLDATLDDVRVYTNALAAPQLANIYAYGRITPIPAVTLASPANGSSFVSTNILLAANVVSNAQPIAGVAFYAGTNMLGQATTSPYAWTWTNALPGNYVLTAKAAYNGTNVISPSVGIVITPATNRPALSVAIASGSLQISWPLDHTGWTLQAQTNFLGAGLGTNWVTISNSNITNQMTLPVASTNASVFYRISYP